MKLECIARKAMGQIMPGCHAHPQTRMRVHKSVLVKHEHLITDLSSGCRCQSMLVMIRDECCWYVSWKPGLAWLSLEIFTRCSRSDMYQKLFSTKHKG